MADVVRTVGTTTGQETSIGDAITYMQSNYTQGTDDLGIIRLVDEEDFAGGVTLGGISGTASATSHLVLETAAAVRHDGTYSGATISTSGSSHTLQLEEDYTHVRHCALKSTSSTSSQEVVRCPGLSNDYIIEKCVIWHAGNTSDQDGIYTGDGYGVLYVFDCVILMGGSNQRAATHAQNYQGSGTHTHYIEHCTIDANGAAYGIAGTEDASATTNIEAYNNIVRGSGTADYEATTTHGASTVFSGNNNLSEDTSITGNFTAGTGNTESCDWGTTDIAATEVYVQSLTAGSENFQLKEGVNTGDTAVDNAASGASQNSGIDLTTDIAGNDRPGTYTNRDCGAFEALPLSAVFLPFHSRKTNVKLRM